MKLIPIDPTKDIFNRAEIARRLREVVRDTAADAKADLEKTVATWQREVNFAITPIADGLLVDTDDAIWHMVDEGTKPHTIPAVVPVKKKALTILGPGRPKTMPRVVGSTSGAKGAVIAIRKSTKVIHHPGTAPREFSETVQDKYDNVLADRVDGVLRETL